MTDTPRARLLTALREALAGGTLAKLTLGAPVSDGPDDDGLKRITGRPVQLKAGTRLQLVYSHPTRDVTKNLPFDEVEAEVAAQLATRFRSAHVYTTEASYQLESRPGKPDRLTKGPAAHSGPPSLAHDREKQRALELDPRWTTALGVTTADGRVLKGMEGKHRQILRFVELLSHLLGDAPRGPLSVVDLGCGKGYLTFAAWQWLRAQGWDAKVTGVELRPALAASSDAVARKLRYDGLTFVPGAIADADLGGTDLVLALHACDTATDDALAAGVAAGARWLVVAPCCHREVRPQLAPPAALAAVDRHGILREREAELVTDALRAALLESRGYDARVFEFVSTEHTAKNLMITAVRTREPGEAGAATALAGFYGVGRQRLAEKLGIPLGPTGA